MGTVAGTDGVDSAVVVASSSTAAVVGPAEETEWAEGVQATRVAA